jgi:hypothetical protein
VNVFCQLFWHRYTENVDPDGTRRGVCDRCGDVAWTFKPGKRRSAEDLARELLEATERPHTHDEVLWLANQMRRAGRGH